MRQYPDYPAGQLALAEILGSEGDLVGALQAMQKYDVLDPDSIPNRVRRCVLLQRFGANAQTKECLARFAQTTPGELAVRVEMAWSALMAGDAEQALRLIEANSSDDPYITMAALLKLGRAREALVIASKTFPEFLLQPAPEIGEADRGLATLIAAVLLNADQQTQGRDLIQRVRRASAETSGSLEAPWAWYEPVALAMLGERDAAISALKNAVANGHFLDLDTLDADVLMSGLHTDPRYEAMVTPARAKAAEQVRLAQAAGLL